MAAEHLKPWRPGQSGNPSGKPKKWLTRIDEMCAKDGRHPYTELMKLIPELRPREQAEIWLQLLSYCQPKPKPIDEPDPDDLAELPTDELIKLVREKLPELEAG